MFLSHWISGILRPQTFSSDEIAKIGNELLLDETLRKEGEVGLEKELEKEGGRREEWKYISKNKFRHIVFSSGALGGLYLYGALKITHEKGLWDYDDIQTIWGTSCGSILGVCLALKYEWSIIDDYFIKRPWKTIFKMDFMRLLNEKGMMGKEVIEDMMNPLLIGKGLKVDITMGEFYLETGIELHIFITELNLIVNGFSTIDVSYKTHPTWRVIDAVYASSCLPFVFVPYEIIEWSSSGPGSTQIEKRRMFLDGGILADFPSYRYLLANGEIDESEILGFYLKKVNKVELEKEITFLSFLKSILNALLNIMDKSSISEKSCFIAVKIDRTFMYDKSVIFSEEKRKNYISTGEMLCLDYLIEKGWLVSEGGFGEDLEDEKGAVEISSVADGDSGEQKEVVEISSMAEEEFGEVFGEEKGVVEISSMAEEEFGEVFGEEKGVVEISSVAEEEFAEEI